MGEEKPTESRTRPKFEPEFKNVAVRLIELGNRSVTQVAEELDISEATLTNWVKNARKAKRAASTGGPNIIEENRLLAKRKRTGSQWCKEILKRFSHLLS